MHPNLLVIGHADHGKDSVAELLQRNYDFKFKSSSMFVLEECIWDDWGRHHYPTMESCYLDRDNHRPEWYNRIAAYNTPDKTRTATTMLSRGYDLYVGMRAIDEYQACVAAEVFDHVVWVDASKRLPPEPSTSFTIPYDPSMLVVDNNGPEYLLNGEVDNLVLQFS